MTQNPSRRTILRAGTVSAASAALAAGAATPASAAPEPVDVLIIGSGYAGAVAALRLAEAGIGSVVLERGRRWTITEAGDTFATPRNLDGRAAWLSVTSPFSDRPLSLFTGVLEFAPGLGVSLLAGAGVGGGSLVNYAVMAEPPQDQFARSFGPLLDHTEMAGTWYPRARALIGTAPIPDDVLNSPYYTNARDFQRQADAAGIPTERAELAMDWQRVREEIAGTAPPAAINAESMFGMNSGAKRSVDRTILAAAEATGHTTVLPLHRVDRLSASGDRYLVRCARLDDNGRVLARPEFRARHVILAAGSLGTARLLVRAKARGDLPGLNDEVGRHWGSGGDHITVRTGMPPNNPAQGGPGHILAKDWADPEAPVTLLGFPVGYPFQAETRATSALGVLTAPALGRFTYSWLTDSVGLHWPSLDGRIRALSTAVDRTLGRINTANPGTWTLASTPAITAHSLGGAVLGRATNGFGELVGQPRLYVVDSSLIPGSTGSVPPALTVTALADRCVQGILAERLT
ncbi:FAD-binding protein [Actinocorallia sp. API 0066]|uniref:FAD-binding protein n=1 Tax=Actinocorallia sp. API 0066 TaxID=2896846 RepID=UPI001E379AC5|nr:FAD-binding protein [Actinocorallia sp. API 0066]MCD0450491.1 FAD-binding protein [Actinocorallia sp. API 0066]